MRSMLRSTAVVGLLLTLAFSLTGCVHLDRNVALNSDGSGTYTLTMGLSEQLVSMAGDQISTSMDQFGAKVKSQGGSYRHYDDTGYSYWAYTRPFKSIDELNQLAQESPQSGANLGAGSSLPVAPTSPSQDTLHFSQQSGFLTNTFHVTGHMSMVMPTPPPSADSGMPDVSQYLKDMRESFSITMPGSISSHKGGDINGNTVTYTVHYGEETDIDVVGGGLNTALLLPIGGGILVIVLLIVGGVIFWRMRGGKHAEQPVVEPVPAFVPAGSDAPTMPGTDALPQ
ncbi:MAG TPA: hypothetical protein VF792_04790 [Ktedonobacterales bacterium]